MPAVPIHLYDPSALSSTLVGAAQDISRTKALRNRASYRRPGCRPPLHADRLRVAVVAATALGLRLEQANTMHPTQQCLPSLERNATAIPNKSGLSSRRHRWLTAGSAAERRNPSMLSRAGHPRPAWMGIESTVTKARTQMLACYRMSVCTAQSVTSDVDKYGPPCTNHGLHAQHGKQRGNKMPRPLSKAQ